MMTIFLIIIFGYLLPYGLTVPLTGEFTPINYFITLIVVIISTIIMMGLLCLMIIFYLIISLMLRPETPSISELDYSALKETIPLIP